MQVKPSYVLRLDTRKVRVQEFSGTAQEVARVQVAASRFGWELLLQTPTGNGETVVLGQSLPQRRCSSPRVGVAAN